MSAKKKAQPAPKWKAFLLSAHDRLKTKTDRWSDDNPEHGLADYVEIVGREIVDHGDGESFLKAVRRGRSTPKQNLRYRLLREVERLCGDGVKRRRPDSNTPDAVALKKSLRLELEDWSDVYRGEADKPTTRIVSL